ncbi:MAG: SusC/RagA family TonB-linked outer membrane protein, partial [Dysgonamonadaceae bacterium]|nr:SusC/RagA family TonB-linked outer membrane protein [Dysgonamonadaceae bacterium]
MMKKKNITAIIAMCFLWAGAIGLRAQEIEIKGQVSDLTTRKGFAGVHISVVNTRLTCMSDDDGSFVLKVPATDVILQVDVPGYQDQLVALQGRTWIEIGLLPLTGATPFYDPDELSPIKASSLYDFSDSRLTIDETLSSRLSGQIRSVSHSGTPGSGAAIFSRGFNTLNTNAQPLFVVDGIVWQNHDGGGSIHEGFDRNPLSLIAPEDVEKVTVLRQGTSLYGSKGANGVIMIDTRRSRSQSTTITVDMGTSYRAPFASMPLMDAGQYRLYASDLLKGNPAADSYYFLEDDPGKSYYNANHNNTDWLGLINEGAVSQNYGVSVQGGDEIALYAISVGYASHDGNVKNTNFSRMNFRVNSDLYLSKKFTTAINIAFSQTNNQLRMDGIDTIASPVYIAMIKSPLYNPYAFDNNGNISKRLSNVDELNVGNPLSIINNGIGQSKQYALNTGLHPVYAFSDKLKAGLLFSYDWKKLNENSFTPDNGVTDRYLYNEQGEVYAVSKNLVQDRMDTHTSILADARIDYNPLKSETHSLNAFAGFRLYADQYKSHYGMGHNTGSDNMVQLSNTTESLRSSDGLDDNWNSLSWYANADYSFKSRYLLSLSAAMDASSRFGKEAEGIHLGGVSWGLFPSAAAGWVISSETFMQKLPFINFLKLTAGYGLSGNDNLPNYASRSYFSPVYYAGSSIGLILDNIGNPGLKWETTGTATLGLDFSLFNNRWNVKAEWYSSHTKDLLTQKQLNDIAGLRTFWSNDGELKNTGYEISTNLRVLNFRDWKLDAGGSVGHYKNEISSLANGAFVTELAGAQILTQEGQAAGVFYGFKTNGVLADKDAATQANLFIRNSSGLLIPFEAGDMRFVDAFNDNVIDDKDRQVIGDPNPDFYGNIHFN